MSLFCENAKIEIMDAALRGRKQKLALLSAVVHSAGTLAFSGGVKRLVIRLSAATAKERLLRMLDGLYGGIGFTEDKHSVTAEALVLEKLLGDLKIFVPDENGALVYQSGIHSGFFADTTSQNAYLRGLFLGAGAVSLNSGYHLEFAFSNGFLADDCVRMLEGAGFPAKTVARKDKIIVYLKDSGAVSDLLAYMGAHKAVLELNGLAVARDANRATNRRLNCDMANIDKTVNVSARQTEAIRLLEELGVVKGLDKKLRETAALRLAHPEASLTDLAELAKLSKSGVRNRLFKLCALAEKRD